MGFVNRAKILVRKKTADYRNWVADREVSQEVKLRRDIGRLEKRRETQKLEIKKRLLQDKLRKNRPPSFLDSLSKPGPGGRSGGDGFGSDLKWGNDFGGGWAKTQKKGKKGKSNRPKQMMDFL